MGAPPFSQAKFAIYARRGTKPLQDAHMACYFLCLGSLGQKLDIAVALFLLMFVCFLNFVMARTFWGFAPNEKAARVQIFAQSKFANENSRTFFKYPLAPTNSRQKRRKNVKIQQATQVAVVADLFHNANMSRCSIQIAQRTVFASCRVLHATLSNVLPK